MTVAERTREAVRAHPFLHRALRAGVVNYTAAARFLDVGEEEAVAVALRRYADDLPHDRSDDAPDDRRVRVDMKSGIGPADDPADAVLAVGDTALAPGGGDGGALTGIFATGDVGPDTLGDVLARLRVEGVSVEAAGASEGHLVVAVEWRDGPNALRLVEDAL